MQELTLSWQKDLGSPKIPCTVKVPNLGEIEIEQSDIDEAEAIGGNLRVEIAEATAQGDFCRVYAVGLFIPA